MQHFIGQENIYHSKIAQQVLLELHNNHWCLFFFGRLQHWGQILSPWLGYIVDSGIGLSYRPISLYVAWRAGTTTLYQSRLYLPSQGLRIWLLVPISSDNRGYADNKDDRSQWTGLIQGKGAPYLTYGDLQFPLVLPRFNLLNTDCKLRGWVRSTVGREGYVRGGEVQI